MFGFVKKLCQGIFQAQEPEQQPITFEDNNQVLTLDDPFTVVTDTATLAIFDVEVLRHRLTDDIDWFAQASFHEFHEVANGDCALISLGHDGAYKIRVTLNELTAQEQRLSHGHITVGVKVVSDQCFIGNAESLPGDNYEPTPQNLDLTSGGFLTIKPGLYDVSIHYIALPDTASADDLPNIVIAFKPRSQSFRAPQEEPSLVGFQKLS